MKANELMIGDYIMLYDDIYIIEEISSNGWAHIIYNDGSKCRVPLSTDYILGELTPVPLTPEILEKNGFDVSDKEVMQYHFDEDGEKYHFSLRQMYEKDGKPHGYSFYAFNVLTLLDYVHELQHALKLCDINKEIEL